MIERKPQVILAYNDVDGACAAACGLTADRSTEVIPTSAFHLGKALTKLSARSPLPQCILIAGVGVFGDPGTVWSALELLRARGSVVIWSTGKAYLKPLEGEITQRCIPVFREDLRTDTAVVAKILGVEREPRCCFLQNVADTANLQVTQEISDWRNLVLAAIDRYMKFYDLEAYPRVIRMLAGLEARTEQDAYVLSRFLERKLECTLSGRSKLIKQLRGQIGKVAPFPMTTVLILGESGVGKEVVARLIHEGSPRAKGPFCAINCATFPSSDLLNSQLFGHVKGAFTGAVSDRPGLFELARGGTLFLDEIGDMSLESQAYLLRVLEDRKIARVGDDKNLRDTDARIVAATNRDLRSMISEGLFREDLFYRLKVFTIRIPPLRSRLQDLDLLVPTLLTTLGKKLGIKVPAVTAHHLEILKSYDWPGNIRQLLALLESALVHGGLNHLEILLEEEKELSRAILETDNHSPSIKPERPSDATLADEGYSLPMSVNDVLSLDDMVRTYIQHVLKRCHGNQARTARLLNISVNTLKRKLDGAE